MTREGDVSINERLALLTDDEAEKCLNGVMRSLANEEPRYDRIFDHPEDMKQIVKTVADDADQIEPKQTPDLDSLSGEEKAKAIRVILAQIAEDEDLRPMLKGWLKEARPTLIVEPVSAALVLGGIVMVLSTHVSVRYKDEGKGEDPSLDVKVEKKPTTEGFLGKFFDIFQPFDVDKADDKADSEVTR